MAIYVDAPIHRWRGQLWCHVFSPDIEKLHSFMLSIGARREWFQQPGVTPGIRWPHYDAPAKRRDVAILSGAVPLERHQTLVMSQVVRNAWFGTSEDPLGWHRARNSPRLSELEAWLLREID